MIELGVVVEILSNMGISISSSALLDFIKRALKEGGSRSVEEFKEELNSFLTIEGVSAESETVIDVLAEQGVVSVRGSNLYAIEEITMGSENGGTLIFGEDSISQTDKTKIEAAGDARIVGVNARIMQQGDGSISFQIRSDSKTGIDFQIGKKQ